MKTFPMIFVAILLLTVPVTADDFVETVTKYKSLVFRVEASDGEFRGTAFTINSRGDMLTCHHVVEEFGVERDTFWVHATMLSERVNGKDSALLMSRYKLKVVVSAVIPKFDCAVLRVLKTDQVDRFAYRFLRKDSVTQEGEEIALCAFISDGFSVPKSFLSRGYVSTLRESCFSARLNGEVDFIQMDLAASRGTSGGPVFSPITDEIVAIQDAGLFTSEDAVQTIYPIAVSIQQILPVLDSLKIPYASKSR